MEQARAAPSLDPTVLVDAENPNLNLLLGVACCVLRVASIPTPEI